MRYSSYRYLYPPRPKNAISPDDLKFWDNGMLTAQPKLNGSNCVIFTNGVQVMVMNRHGQRLTNFSITQDELKSIYRGNPGDWMVINGEYLNKSKQDERGVTFNHKLVIFDILVFKSKYLIGSSFNERIEILDEIYGTNESEKDYLYSITDNIYRVKSYTKNFKQLYDGLFKDSSSIYEGLVMKSKSAKLEIGNTENNNTKSQIKCRISTKNYKY